jgi:hypothetical protein
MVSTSRAIAFAVAGVLLAAAGSLSAQGPRRTPEPTLCDKAQLELKLHSKILERFREIAREPGSSKEDQQSAEGAVVLQKIQVEDLHEKAKATCNPGPIKIGRRDRPLFLG